MRLHRCELGRLRADVSPYNPPYSTLVNYYYPRVQAVIAALAEYAYSTQSLVATLAVLPIIAGAVSAFTSALYTSLKT